MGLTNVAGVFSRYFVVGFFLPAFFAFVVLAHTVSQTYLPPVYREASEAGQIAIVGGAALLAGLLLLGLHNPILRCYEGYPLAAAAARARRRRSRLSLARIAYDRLLAGQRRRMERVRDEITAEGASEDAVFDARTRLDQRFPHDKPTLLLPTTFGNALRAFERHPRIRWHLNAIGAWPAIEMLLSSQEAQVHADAKGDVAFFVNGSLLSALAGAVLVADAIEFDHAPAGYVEALLCALPFVLSVLAYRAAIGAVIRWGSAVRASIDLHRRELYAQLGIRQPRDFSDERRLAIQLNATLLVGDAMPDEYAAAPESGGATNGFDPWAWPRSQATPDATATTRRKP